MKIIELLVLLVMIAALGFGSYVLWMNLPGESKISTPYLANYSNNLGNISISNKIVQFYPNMRFEDRNISYGLESSCSAEKWNNIERAFAILSNKTVLRFYSTNENPEIKVMCSEISPQTNETGHFIAGEGGPSEVINTTNFAVILNGRISLYKEEKCDEPKIAIHEILHALGFDHYNNTNSIMYPITDCKEQIDQEIIDDINRLYSFDSLPDLVIDSVNANITGRYLDFDINISNQGLRDSKGVELYLYSNNEKITNFTIGNLSIGMTKMLFVQNSKVPLGSSKILFEVTSDDRGELSMQNNQVEMQFG